MLAPLERRSAHCISSLPDEELLALARAGNRYAVEQLLTRYRSFVEARARCYFLSGADHEDVVQEGMIGLYKAIRDFRAGRLSRFRAFAELCVTRQIISAVKSAARRKHLPLNRYISLDGPVGEGEASLLETIPDQRCQEPASSLLNRRLSDYLDHEGRKELSELENRVIRSRLEGKTYEQVARELQCPPKSIDNALQRAKRKIWSRIATGAER
jgi:RNA polymerase sporulation-specific sigma factor